MGRRGLKAGRQAGRRAGLPLELVSEQSRLVFTRCLQGWGRLWWTDAVLCREQKRKDREECGEGGLSNGRKKSHPCITAALGFGSRPRYLQGSQLCRRLGGSKFCPPPPSPMPSPHLDLLMKDLVVLLLLVQEVLLLRLLQSPLVHVAPVHLLELLTLLK